MPGITYTYYMLTILYIMCAILYFKVAQFTCVLCTVHFCTILFLSSLVGYAREQLVHVLAVIAKRRTLECDKKLLFDSIFSEVTQLLGMDPLKVHTYCVRVVNKLQFNCGMCIYLYKQSTIHICAAFMVCTIAFKIVYICDRKCTFNIYTQQQLGCSLLSAILVEYSSSSGSSAVGLTWEFHFHCKKAIEV